MYGNAYTESIMVPRRNGLPFYSVHRKGKDEDSGWYWGLMEYITARALEWRCRIDEAAPWPEKNGRVLVGEYFYIAPPTPPYTCGWVRTLDQWGHLRATQGMGALAEARRWVTKWKPGMIEIKDEHELERLARAMAAVDEYFRERAKV
jgi:hypothetical protein